NQNLVDRPHAASCLCCVSGYVIAQRHSLTLETASVNLFTGTQQHTRCLSPVALLAGAACWAIHVLLAGILAIRYDPIRVSFFQFSICALASLALALRFESIDPDAIRCIGNTAKVRPLFSRSQPTTTEENSCPLRTSRSDEGHRCTLADMNTARWRTYALPYRHDCPVDRPAQPGRIFARNP